MQRRSEDRNQFHVASRGMLEHSPYVSNRHTQVERHRTGGAAESQYTPCQFAGPKGSVLDLLNQVAIFGAELATRQDQLGVAKNRGQQIIDVMNNAGCDPDKRIRVARRLVPLGSHGREAPVRG
jgi:hypothetical protein